MTTLGMVPTLRELSAQPEATPLALSASIGRQSYSDANSWTWKGLAPPVTQSNASIMSQ